jgi:hypothetical protein
MKTYIGNPPCDSSEDDVREAIESNEGGVRAEPQPGPSQDRRQSLLRRSRHFATWRRLFD